MVGDSVAAPDGARATVQVTPNPTRERGQRVTISGRWGGGDGLRAVLSGFDGNPILEDVEIVRSGPDRFEARATLRDHIGHGAGPVFVDCGGQLGVTLLVTHV